MYTENELAREKSRIKYFRILPPKVVDENGEGRTLRKYDYKAGMILELRPGEIEHRLIPQKHGRYYDVLQNYFKSMQLWDYRKTFDFSKWIGMQKPITFDEVGRYELQYESGDRVLVGNWIKSKVLQLFIGRKAPFNNRGEIINNCGALMALVQKGLLRTIDTSENNVSRFTCSEEEVIEYIMKKWCFGEWEDREIYPFLYRDNFFASAKILSGTQELYESYFKEGLIIPYRKDEEWNLAENRELLLGMINQAFYEMLILHSREVQGSEKDRVFEDEFRNRIRILRDSDSHVDRIYYQAIDDDIATDKILELQRQGYDIVFDEYDFNCRYPNGHIRYFAYMANRFDYKKEEEARKAIEPYADQLTDVEAKRIFPEHFYYGRAYYQVKSGVKIEDYYGLGINYCRQNPNNFYSNGNIQYFWVNYFGEMDDFQKRERILRLADELSPEIATQLRMADEEAEYNHNKKQSIQDKLEKFMKSSGFTKKYQKAVKRAQGKIPTETEFAKAQMEENARHLRQKRLHDDKRTRTLTIDEMVAELDSIAKNRYDYKDELGEELYWKLYDRNVDFDDVIQILSDVILTEDDAKCIAISWRLSKRIGEKDVTSDTITGNQVIEFFQELWEDSDINKTSSEVIARIYNSNIERLMNQRNAEYAAKVEVLNAMRPEYKGVEL